MKKLLCLLLAMTMLFSLVACGDNGDTPVVSGDSGNEGENAPVGGEVIPVDPTKSYIYKTSVSTLATNWNPHVYQTADDRVPLDYTTDSFYTLIFNDANHPVEGKETFDGYVTVPSMAAEMPVDITESVKAEHPEFKIPDSATSGYAWSIKLRDDLKWDDGTPIVAGDFVESIKRVLDPTKLNYRAADVYDGSYAIVNAKEYGLAGNAVFTSFDAAGTTYEEWIAAGHTDDEVAVDMNGFWGVTSADGKTYGVITDDTMVRDPAVEEGQPEDYVSAKYLWDNYLGPNGAYAGTGYDLAYAGTVTYPYEDGYSFDNVGIYAPSDTELVCVFRNAVDGFYLTNMALGVISNQLVKVDLYDSLLKETETASGTVWSSTYNTSVDTTASFGPYKMSDYQLDKSMHFVKNDNWAGWNYDWINYVDPTDGNTYQMYQTTEIDIQVVTEPATSKQMFLAGQQMTYGLQAEDFDQYRTSEFYYATPAETVFFLLFNGYEKVINDREAAADFDAATTDYQVQMLESFRRACAVSIDRELMAATVSPARSGGYAFLGNTYIYDPETCAYYRDTDQAKMALVDFYSINLDDYNGDLDAAVDSITGYDPETAKEKFTEAYNEAIEKGYVTDNDGDGKSDQTVTMIYAMSSEMSDFYRKTLDFLNTSLNEGAAGTGFEGKIAIVASAPVGNAWSDNIRNGLMDTQLAGWSGSTLDPFGMADTWTRKDAAYWGNWWDASTFDMTVNIDGKDLTMSIRDYAECLNGNTKTVDGVDYNFGYGQVDVETRLDILAEIERQMLTSYNCVPILQDGGGSLLSQQVYYVVEDYNPMLGRGGISYMKYNYDETEWADYVASQGGTLQY